MNDRQSSRGYVRTLTNAQLDGVIELETARIKRFEKGNPVHKAAVILRDEARREKERRGIQ